MELKDSKVVRQVSGQSVNCPCAAGLPPPPPRPLEL